ncbi:MAG: hypothetical protein DI539_05580 [Flavobacterium psychrophilum]|nr:MAG: hypothetical protein DI539_05580 [Flavobacterium psychrophilum]
MIEELIRRTNLKEFYHDCDFKLESYHYKASKQIFSVTTSINQISYDHFVEYEEWKITCVNTESVYGFDFDIMMPYVKMKILDDHPLLWLYHNDELYCDISGTPKDFNQFVYQLVQLLEAETGGWLAFHDLFRGFMNLIHKGMFTTKIPFSLAKSLETICEEQNLTFKIIERSSGEDKGYANKPNSKLLMFGNSDVSPYEYNLGQSYVIADEFTAERIK